MSSLTAVVLVVACLLLVVWAAGEHDPGGGRSHTAVSSHTP
jgi:hypothetical protein